MKTYLFLLVLVSLAIISSCKQKEEKVLDELLPEDFEVFYNAFHSDSLYQMAHIQFPLEGATQAHGNNIEFMVPMSWEKENWIMHRPFNDHNQTFQRKFYKIGPVIIEKIADQNQFFSMERRFTKFGEDWHLIYYSVSN